jgi:hypothetical protein
MRLGDHEPEDALNGSWSRERLLEMNHALCDWRWMRATG